MPDDAIERARARELLKRAFLARSIGYVDLPTSNLVSIPCAIDALLLAFASQQAPAETVSLDDGFTIDLDADDFTVCWPDGRWLVAHRNGKITVGKSPFDKAVPPKQTTLTAMLDAAPSVTLGEVG